MLGDPCVCCKVVGVLQMLFRDKYVAAVKCLL